MTALRLLYIFLLMGFYSCIKKPAKHKVDPAAVDLHNNAMAMVPYVKNADSSRKAILLLDSATSIDSNYYRAYFHKLMFLYSLKQYDKAIVATQNLIRLRPGAHDLHTFAGIFYEKINDSISSKKYFQKSLSICNTVLDTMRLKNIDYEMFTINKAVNLIMLNRNTEANRLLNQLAATQAGGEMKEIAVSMIGLNKDALIEMYYDGKVSR